MSRSMTDSPRVVSGIVALLLAGFGMLLFSGCNRTSLADDPPLAAQYDPPPPPADPYESNALAEGKDATPSVDWVGYDGEDEIEMPDLPERDSDGEESTAALSEPLKPLEPPQQVARADFPALPESGDPSKDLPEYEALFGDSPSAVAPSLAAPSLIQGAAEELARSIFDAVENRDRTAFLQSVSSIDAEDLWRKVSREKGRWEVDAKPSGPMEMTVSTTFRADRATGVFEKTYRWRLQWSGGWKVVEWRR